MLRPSADFRRPHPLVVDALGMCGHVADVVVAPEGLGDALVGPVAVLGVGKDNNPVEVLPCKGFLALLQALASRSSSNRSLEALLVGFNLLISLRGLYGVFSKLLFFR